MFYQEGAHLINLVREQKYLLTSLIITHRSMNTRDAFIYTVFIILDYVIDMYTSKHKNNLEGVYLITETIKILTRQK